ncbi:hypothetical protein BpHYR1_004609 [Brachionus plicatilis]|uniref:Uncharacterized protein n=1 Tax=Brachionus plicatilis TaxID=10195 RepID=A0A3M7PB82_BRAPC|nr:hypothetical protein BpHYR1_004609 [Brachionus plicatilis]
MKYGTKKSKKIWQIEITRYVMSNYGSISNLVKSQSFKSNDEKSKIEFKDLVLLNKSRLDYDF